MRCSETKACRSRSGLDSVGLLSGILVVIIPKCSLCVAAYGGALALCSGTATIAPEDKLGLGLSILASITLLMGIGFNNRGKRTGQALVLATLGMSLVFISQLSDHTFLHYPGAIMIFLGVWTNGSLYYVLRKLRPIFNHQLIFKIPTK